MDETKLKQEFAKAFHWYEPRKQYDYGEPSKPRTPSWEEIFVEMGKILAARDFRDFEGNVSELECKLQDLERRLKSEVHPNPYLEKLQQEHNVLSNI